MNLIPVIDLLDGEVVHAVAGNRSRYQTFSDSRFIYDSPARLIELWLEEYRPQFIYIADLNAILGIGNNLEVVRTWSRFNVRYLIDFGFRNWEQVSMTRSELGAFDWIPVLGTETIESIEPVADSCRRDPDSCFVSIDIRNQKVLSNANQPLEPQDCLRTLMEHGVQNIIVLDLDSVGVQSGCASCFSSLAAIAHPSVRLFAGGGVRDLDDIKQLSDLGFSGVLTATSLHRGKIKGADIDSLDHSKNRMELNRHES